MLLNLEYDVIASNNIFYAISIPQNIMSQIPKSLICEALKKGILHTYQQQSFNSELNMPSDVCPRHPFCVLACKPTLVRFFPVSTNRNSLGCCGGKRSGKHAAFRFCKKLLMLSNLGIWSSPVHNEILNTFKYVFLTFVKNVFCLCLGNVAQPCSEKITSALHSWPGQGHYCQFSLADNLLRWTLNFNL